MNSRFQIKNEIWGAVLRAALLLNSVCLIFNSVAVEGTNGAVATNGVAVTTVRSEKAPETPREFFNAGTRWLEAGKLREAEATFHTALVQQDVRWQAPVLHNLGHVRYRQGAEELDKSPDAGAVLRRGEAALERGNTAMNQISDVLPGNDVQSMVSAYLNGRGSRKELREATDLVRRALEAHGATLQKWQRALGDFKSALELNPADEDARKNIATIEAAIARLIDKIKRMAALAQAMGQMRADLGKMMSQLLGKIPAPNAPPGEEGDEDEDDAQRPNGPREGQEQRGREGAQRRQMSREEAGWLLQSFKLGGEKRLPMGQGGEGKPKTEKGKNW